MNEKITEIKKNQEGLSNQIKTLKKNIWYVYLIFASAPKCRGAVLEATMIGDGGTFHAHAQ